MPQFTVVPHHDPKQAIVTEPTQVFPTISKLDCHGADVLCDGEYSFSVKRGGDGMWVLMGRSGSICAKKAA